MLIKPKNHNRTILLYVLIGMVLIGALIGVSFLLFDKIGIRHEEETWAQYWDRIKPLIVASIITYLGWIQLAYRFTLDIILYIRKFKQVKNVKVELIEAPSAYAPKQTKKIKQTKDLEKCVLENKIGDNLVRITPKEIVVVYGREFVDKEDYLNSIVYTFGEIKEIIRKKK